MTDYINKKKKTDEFIRLAKMIKEHLEAENVALTDYEIGHLAVMFQSSLEEVAERTKQNVIKEIKQIGYTDLQIQDEFDNPQGDNLGRFMEGFNAGVEKVLDSLLSPHHTEKEDK